MDGRTILLLTQKKLLLSTNFLLLLFFLNICIPIYINKSIDVDFNGG